MNTNKHKLVRELSSHVLHGRAGRVIAAVTKIYDSAL